MGTKRRDALPAHKNTPEEDRAEHRAELLKMADHDLADIDALLAEADRFHFSLDAA